MSIDNFNHILLYEYRKFISTYKEEEDYRKSNITTNSNIIRRFDCLLDYDRNSEINSIKNMISYQKKKRRICNSGSKKKTII